MGDSHFYVIISQAHIIADFLKKGTKSTQLTMTNILQCQEISQVKELISYLKSQIKSSLNKPRFYEFYELNNAPSIKKIQKYENKNQELAEQARAELNKELKSYANENDNK